MSFLKQLFRLFAAAAESSSGQSGTEASARAADLHSSATEAYESGDDPIPALRERARATLKRYTNATRDRGSRRQRFRPQRIPATRARHRTVRCFS